jgi:cytochrome c
MKFVTLSLALAGLLISGNAFAQDLEAGQRSFSKCRACHQVGPDAKNIVGPQLNDLFNRTAGSVEGYTYSEANKKSGIKWDDATFKTYITNPRAAMPGNKMAFAGITNEIEIANLTAFLKQYGPDGKTK